MALGSPKLAAAAPAATATVDKQIEEDIHKLCAEVLSRPLARVKLGRSFLAHGGDSLLAIKLMARCQSMGYTINVQDLLQATSIREFCRYVQRQTREDDSALPLSNGHVDPSVTAPLDVADTGDHLTPADVLGPVDRPQELEKAEAQEHTGGKGRLRVDDEVPPFSLWQEAERVVGNDGKPSSTTMDEQLRLVAEQCGVSIDMIEDVYPCTPLQEILMAVTATQPRAYVNRWVYRIPPELDTARLKESWVQVARAAPLLRTRLVLGSLGTALQVVPDDCIPTSPPFPRFIRYLGNLDEAAAASFWQSQLSGQSPAPFPTPPKPSYNPDPSQIMIHSLTATPAFADITMSSFLRAAWALAVSSCTGVDDVVFACVLSGRTAPVRDVSDMLAPTITTVPVRIRIDKAQPTAEYLAAVQQQAVSMMPFEHTGLQSIYRHTGARLDLGHLFTVQPADVWTSVTTTPPLGLEVHTAPDTRADGYGLSIECLTGGNADPSVVKVHARFDDTMVSRSFLERLLARFAHILTRLTDILHEDGGVIGDLVSIQEEDAPAAPVSRLQEQLQAVFAKVLGLPADEALMNRSFLSLGGDSISAMQVISECRNQHGIILTVRDILQSMTVAQIISHASLDADPGHLPGVSLNRPLRDVLAQLNASRSFLERAEGKASDTSTPDLAHEGLFQLWASMSQVGIAGVDEVEDVYFCSPTQQSIVMSQTKDHTTYRIRRICELNPPEARGRVDIDRLSQSWRAVVSRHQILRTIFVQVTTGEGHLFYQVVLKRCNPQVRVVNQTGPNDLVSTLSQAEPVPFISGQPNHSLSLYTTESGAVYAKLEISPALVDGASLDLVLRDLVDAYEDTLPESAAPSFGAYVEFLPLKLEAESLAYWTHQLADAQPCYLPPSATQLMKPTATGKVGASVVTAYIGDINIFHGFRDAHRVPGADEIVGPMLNMMISRIRLGDPSMTVAHAAQQVQCGFLKAFENHRTSFRNIQPELQLPEKGLFNTTVSYFRQSSEHVPASGRLGIRNVAMEGSTEYDASLQVQAGDSTMEISLRYSTSFMDEESARLVLENTRHTLLSIAGGIKNKLDELEALSPSDFEKMIQWNPDLPPATNQDCLQQRIRQQCLARSDAQAVCSWDGELSYAELDALSDRLARHLDELGVCEDTMVGLCFEKSMWTIVAMLAVIKAGGVIVPLGMKLPPQRLSMLLENTKASVVLTSDQCASVVEHVEAPHKCIVDAAFFEKLPEAAGPPARPSPTSERPVLVMYTSGSTGLPKGAVVTHGGLCASLDAHGATVCLDTNTRTLQYAAYTFDASIFDILGTLWFGGCICVVSEEDRMNPNDLARVVRDMEVNFMLLTPTVASILDPTAVPSLRTLALGGEALRPAVVEMWSSHASIFNCYGPTECSIMCAINGPVTDKNLSSNIGRSPAASVWVVNQDDYNRLVPIGAVGELLIEGPLLAQGYLHDPERTAAVFITDPAFVSRHELAKPHRSTPRRMYRTGDLVRQNPADGSLTYVGRGDGQFKIRGQRLEVGEIEYWAKQFFDQAREVVSTLIAPAVRNGVPVLAIALEISCQDTPDSTSPFLPLTDALRCSLSALQDNLARALPSFMVPSMYVPVRRMPLTTSGKIDRGQLRNLLNDLGEDQLSQYALIHESRSSGRPLTDSESRLRDLWVSVLSTNAAIGPASDFFRLGGDSVIAMRLIAMAAKATPPIRLTIADVFGNLVLENMAKIVAGNSASNTGHVDASSAGGMDVAPFSLMPTSSASQDTLVRLSIQCGVTPDDIEDAYPCTPLQEGLLALTAREQSAYVGCWVFRMGDDLDVDRFRSAWEKVSEMAIMLRTRIIAGDGAQAGTQVVIRESLPWSTVSSDLETYLSQDEPDSMGVGRPLMRFAVVLTPQSGRFFVWKAHHSTYDGWSCFKLLRAVRDVYSGQETTAFVPYTRFIKYLRRENAQSEAEEYWRSELKGDLGSGFPTVPPNHRSRSSSALSFRIAPAAARSIFTTATLLRAAWALVLSQETGSRDVVFAVTLSGRMAPVPGILDMAAPTLATAPVRINTSRNRSVGDYLATVQQQAVDMIPFEHIGLQNINRMLPGKTLELNHLFVVQPFADRVGQDSASLLPQGLEPVPHSSMATFHAYPLVVECNTGSEAQDESHDVELEAHFDETVLPSDKARTIMERFRHIFVQLRAAAASGAANSPLAHVDMLGPQDLSRIRGWNRWSPEAESKSDKCIHDLVHLQSLAQPNAQAVCAWDGQLTYAELDSLSLNLAHHLVGLGVCPEAPVLMMFEKSFWAVVAHLAILRAGGVVVPVGHNHPVQRVQGIIQATGARVLLSSKEYKLHCGLVPHVLAVNQHLMSGLPSRKQGPACEVINATNAAFIIFTSGSTGVPKGVVLEHRALATSLKTHVDLFAGPTAPRALQFASYTFDGSIAETFIPLISGGCVCVPSEEDRVSNLAAAMETMRVSFACLTPTVAGFLQPETVPSLKTLLFVGEALKREVVARWVGGGVQTWNAYGPSECSITSTCSRLSDKNEVPSIGTAVPGSNVWVVDPLEHHCLVPVGVPGELLLEGPLLARGYLGDGEKTAAAFITNPAWLECFDFGPKSGRRFYRTGDLVRQAPDGSLMYLGRRDMQVKLHGQRLEIGEIEHWVKKILGVQAGAAVAGLLTREGENSGAGEPVLSVAVEMDRHAESEAGLEQDQRGESPFSLLPLSDNKRELLARLRDSLSKVLPSYMVPRLYIPVDKLPTTDSGKLDRRVVWATIQQSRRSSQYSVATDHTKVAPDTDTGRQLQKLWAAALRIPPQDIGAGDDFFLSGGDSISAMRVVAKARGGTRMPLAVADIFQHPVLADLAKVIDARQSENAHQQSSYRPFSTIRVAESGPHVAQFIQPLLLDGGHAVDAAPVTDSQGLSVVMSLRNSRDYTVHITFAREGPCEVEKWRASCWELIRRHEALRTAYVFVKEQLLQVVLEAWQPAIGHFETEDATVDGFTKDLIARDMDRPLCLGRPFVEFAIITSPSQHRILFRICHAEYDRMSMSHYLDDLGAIHAGKADSAESSSFIRDFVSTLGGEPEKLRRSRSYWRDFLQGALMPRIAPPQVLRPSELIHHGMRNVSLPSPSSRSGEQTTAATLMRAAWGLTLSRYTGLADVTFGDVVSGRSAGEPKAVHATGCCANIVAARIVVRADASVRDLLDAAQAQHVARRPHETVGFRELLGNRGKMAPEDPHFTTRINHIDHQSQWDMRVGDDIYQTTIDIANGVQDVTDLYLMSYSHPDHIQVAFMYRDGAISAETADQILSCLCAASELLAAPSSQTMRLGELELGPCSNSWPVAGNGSVALGIGQPNEEADCGT
ncbi:hypothetical protein CHGG_04477 [Chaetomium globosum CBS 148.51]|uniref:Carrier domain-containing protein n=1 Tax=Chaetomium globosum (strain ATCC 6205 / CBS 148.51 / DSM 1962 / NBRC 6347 / NRRL 1970) TaxID=306901 RepID=Q2H169_CHAGB|nr:uncharacterized protein CHGG_04477 [Chaetomium globosum CBS 148.51]EAQ87858.1 hypothetical protein CHGG_04477 [Chaetomium globosum CBS 148.51]